MAEQLLLYKAEQAAEKLSIGRSRVFELLKSGEIESVSIGKSRRIASDALDAYVAKLRAEQHPGTRRHPGTAA